MLSVLLVIIYISFISLGLPDALLGAAWPSMHGDILAPVSAAGIISMVISGGTIISSLLSNRIIKKLGTGKVTLLSVFTTAVALFGFSLSHSIIALCLWAIPYGLGAGSVDAALNNFVAIRYKARHMSWLHSFWGLGASIGPYIMGLCLTRGAGWSSGYRTVALIQICLTAILLVSLPYWRKTELVSGEAQEVQKSLSVKRLFALPGAKFALGSFFCYCALESTAGLWGSSYMVISKGVSPEEAAKWTSFFYLGITAGRFLSGFVTMKTSDKSMVRLGQGIAVLGIAAILLPVGNVVLGVGLTLIGVGCAPIFPSLLHETPVNFGKGFSQAIMGMQMACAYIGSTFMPPLVGLTIEHISVSFYPVFLLLFVVVMVILVECLNKMMGEKKG